MDVGRTVGRLLDEAGENTTLHTQNKRHRYGATCIFVQRWIVVIYVSWKIACGAFHNLALDRKGHIYAWGINDYGQLGNGGTKYSMTPTRVVDLDDVSIVEIAAGGWHSVAVSKEGPIRTHSLVCRCLFWLAIR